MKYFTVSDVHDHYDLLLESLNNKGFDIENKCHKLVVCGDAFYSGPQPGELFVFLKGLLEKGKLIFVRGNHDCELLDNLRAGAFGRNGNRVCVGLVVEYLTGKKWLTDAELISESEKLGFTDFLKNAPVWYYETDKYVFTHGFIPTKKHEYITEWRDSTESDWHSAAFKGDAMLLNMKYGVRVPQKTVVCGHYSAARCYLMKDATSEDWENKIYKDVSKVPKDGFKAFYGNGIAVIDGSTKKTGFVNCEVFEDT